MLNCAHYHDDGGIVVAEKKNLSFFRNLQSFFDTQVSSADLSFQVLCCQ